MNENDMEWVEGSGNVFRDFGDPQADLKQAKAVLAARIIAALDERELTVRKAASRTGFAAADFSRIRNADLGRFTLDRLMKILGALDGRVSVSIVVGLRIPLKVTSQSRSKLPVNPVQKYHPIHGKVTAWAVADERSLGATRRGGGHYG